MENLPWWKKALALGAIILATVLFTLATVLGKDVMSRLQLKNVQGKDEATRKREIDLINAAAGAKVEAVNAKADLAAEKAAAEHKAKVEKIEEEARRESPVDPDQLAADLRNSILR